MILALSNLMVEKITQTDSGVEISSASFLYTLQSLFVALEMVAGLIIISRRRKLISTLQRSQVRFFSAGVMTAILLNMITGLLFVIFSVSGSQIALLTSSSILIMSTFIWISITRHGLLNIRSIVARTIAYVLSALIVASGYAFIVSFLIETYIESKPLSVLLVGISTLFVLAFFKNVKKTFDHITNKLFYREAYSSREKLDELTDNLVSYISLEKLVKASLKVIVNTLRPLKVSLVINEDKNYLVFGHNLHHNIKFTEKLEDIVSSNEKDNILIVDMLPDDQAQQFRQAKISVITTLRSVSMIEGYLVLGPRSSGEAYSKQDLSFLRIAAKNIGLAINNAKSYQQISNFNQTLTTKVNKATSELRTKNRELKNLHKLKDDFISMASHQLRPKVAASLGFLELFQNSDIKADKEQNELLDLTKQSIDQISDIVVDMLDIHRMEDKNMKLNLEELNLYELTEECVSSKEEKHPKRFVIKATSDAKKFVAELDKIKIREVITNLLDNANQYSPSNEKIIIELNLYKKHFELLVSDKGIGMDHDEKAKLFKKFYRSEKAKKVRPNGSGIGLYACKLIVEAHKGKMIVSSKQNIGSTIGFKMNLS
jgi:signal transduction histidine kinase